MALIATYQGALEELKAAFRDSLSGMRIRLFTNNLTPTDATVLSDMTEGAWTGYAAVAPTWPTPSLDGSNVANSASGNQQFFFTAGSGSATVYGYYLTNSSNTILYGVERFGTTVTLSPTINVLNLAVTYTTKSEF